MSICTDVKLQLRTFFPWPCCAEDVHKRTQLFLVAGMAALQACICVYPHGVPAWKSAYKGHQYLCHIHRRLQIAVDYKRSVEIYAALPM